MRELGHSGEPTADRELTHEPVNEKAKQHGSGSFSQHNLAGDERGSTNILEGQGALPDTYWARELDVDLEEWNTYLRGDLPDRGIFLGITCTCWSMLCCLTKCTRGQHDVERAGKDNHEPARKGILHMTTWAPSSRVCRVWIFVVGSIDLWYTAFLMPVLIVFPSNSSNYVWGTIINLIFGGAFYWVDIFMRFRMGFCVVYNLKRELIMDGGLIAHFYVRHDTFLTDFIAACPAIPELVWVCLHGTDYGLARQIVLLLRLARMRRVFTLIKGMLTMTLTGQYSRKLFRGLSVGHVFILMLTYVTFWLLNLLGCSWVWLAGIQGKENSWMQSIGNEVDISGKTPARQWIAGIYFAVMMVTTVGLGDIKACTPAEEVLASFQMLLGVFLFGLIVSTSQSVLAMLSDNARTMGPLRQKLQYVEVWLHRRHLSDRLARRIRAYYTEIWAAHKDLEHDKFYEELPAAMRADVAAEITQEIFDKSCFLSVLHGRARRTLCERLKPYSLPAGHAACQEGDKSDTVWLLSEGEMLASRREKKEEYIAAPAILGETSILAAYVEELATRPSTIEAIAPCTLWTLQVKDLDTLVDLYPELAGPLQQGFRQHLQNHLQRSPGHKWAHILKRYKALPDDEKPFAAPANRKHVAKNDSMDKGKAHYQGEAHSDLDDDESVDSHEQTLSGLPDGSGERPHSAAWRPDDSARARQLYLAPIAAQDMYSQPRQPSSDWQR